MMQKKEKKKLSLGQIIGLVVFLLALEAPDLFATILLAVLLLGPIALVVWLVRKYAKQDRSKEDIRNVTYTRKAEALDDCRPKPLFCFHKDKGEHHVARGKEIDPWDRPDIDISKYQRRQ